MITCDCCSEKIDTLPMSQGDIEDLASSVNQLCKNCKDIYQAIRDKHYQWYTKEREKLKKQMDQRIDDELERIRGEKNS